jgi:RNA polymerase sigma-70 factor, ECF subfamily
MENQATDEQLLDRMRLGDESAFVSLYQRRQGAIYRFALHMCGSAAVAEDVTQEVFLTLIRENCGYDGCRGTLAGYLFGIARKLVLRYLERGRSLVGLEPQGDDPEIVPAVFDDPLEDLTRRETVEALWRAVLALPRRYREVVILCDLEELDYADAAAALGCPVGTVRSRLHRARALLLEKLRSGRNTQVPAGFKPIRCVV